MFKVLGCFSADRAALNTVNRSYITKELSLFSQEDGNPICFFILTSCFLGGVSAIYIKNIFHSSAVQPGSFNHESWITLALCPVNGSSAPRCVYKSHVSSVELCDSNVDVRGATQRELPTVKSFSWEFFVGAKSGYLCTNAVSAFDSFARSTSQMPAHSRSSAMSLFYLLLKSVSAEISCFCLKKFIFLRARVRKGVLMRLE